MIQIVILIVHTGHVLFLGTPQVLPSYLPNVVLNMTSYQIRLFVLLDNIWRRILNYMYTLDIARL